MSEIKINQPDNPAPQGSLTWTTGEMTAEFDVSGFYNGLVIVIRKSDGVKGTLQFNGHPRVYHSWMEDSL